MNGPPHSYSAPSSCFQLVSFKDAAGEELELLIACLKEGGVSLIGKQQVFTREQYRKSFVKRNKNPEINEKVHHIRTLQSTLKAGGAGRLPGGQPCVWGRWFLDAS